MTTNTSDHTVGSHSDDRGGSSDFPCYCNQLSAPTNLSTDELRETMINILEGAMRHQGVSKPTTEMFYEDLNEIMALFSTYQQPELAAKPLFTLFGEKLTMLRESANMQEFDIDGRRYLIMSKATGPASEHKAPARASSNRERKTP